MSWIDPWVGLGRDFSVFDGLGSVHYSESTKKFERIVLMRLKHGKIRFGCTKQLNLLVVGLLGRVGLGPIFSLVMGWVSQPMGWVGSGHTKWTHGQLWSACKHCAQVSDL